MAIAKVILNGETLMDVTSDTVEASKLLSTYTATKNDGTKISGSYVPPSPVISSLTVTPTETAQTFNAAAVSGYKPVTVEAINSNYIGSAVPLKSEADLSMSYNNATDTADITSPYGYYSSQAVYKMSRALSNMSGPFFNSSTGLFSGAVNITTSGYISSKTISYSHQLTTLSAQTIYPSTADQTVASYRWLTGTQTIKSVTTNNLTAANIVSGTVVKVGDATNASRITQVTGTYSGIIPTGTSNITSNGTYDVKNYASASVSVAGGEYYGLYKALAERQIIYASGSVNDSYTSTDVSDYFNSLSTLELYQLAGVFFSGNFNFSNVSLIDTYACGFPYTNTLPARITSASFNFPSVSKISVGAFVRNRYINSITASNCTVVGNYAFQACVYLTNVSLPECTSVDYGAFSDCNRLTTINLPKCLSVYSSAFYYCTSLITVSLSKCTSINNNVFYSCTSLTNVSLPECTCIGASVFYYCISLTTISLPKCTSIGSGAFYSCFNLTNVSLPECTNIGSNAFYYCTSLTTISLPKCTSVGNGAFSSCANLTNVSLPECTNIGTNAFNSCISLTTISLPKCTNIGSYAFNRCYNLLSLYLLGSSVVTLGAISAFSYTPISTYTTSTGGVYGSIYVPSSLYNSYITATNWKIYSARFVSV